jgi:hypothetical protein
VIASAILESKKINKGGVHRNEVYRSVVDLLGHPLSQRQFCKYIDNMMLEKLLNKSDPKGKRGSKVYLSLTKKGSRKHHLKILGTDKLIERQKSLYQLIIFFQAFKRSELLSKRKLGIFLKRLGSSAKKLEKAKEIKVSPGNKLIIFKPIIGTEILGIVHGNRKGHFRTVSYYTVTPGFTVKEFHSYLEKLIRDKDPRPFSRFFPKLQIPFVNYRRYTLNEVIDAVNLLREDGIIQIRDGLYPGETRYDISNESLRALVRRVWFIHIIEFSLLIGRLLKDKPVESDKNYLTLSKGNWAADGMIAYAHHIRRSLKNQSNRK